MVYKVNVEQAAEQLPELIAAAVQGDEVLIVTANQQVVRLIALSQTKPQREFDTAKGLIEMSDDFDEPLEDFQEYM
jgi:antitoxin (DNA-binding transcriptional repressor) of toxin-antitoxin stability system